MRPVLVCIWACTELRHLGSQSGGELLAGHVANAYEELGAIQNDLFKNTLQKIIDGAASAGVGCLVDVGVDQAKVLLATVVTGGLDYVLLAAKAVANAALIGAFITADWYTHHGKHTVVSLKYTPPKSALSSARVLPATPSNVQITMASQNGSATSGVQATWKSNSSNAAGFNILFERSGLHADEPPTATVPGDVTTFTYVLPLSIDKTKFYCFFISAFNDFGETPEVLGCFGFDAAGAPKLSSSAQQLAPTPSNLQVAFAGKDASGKNQWRLSWVNTTTNKVDITIYAGFGGKVKQYKRVFDTNSFTDSLSSSIREQCYYIVQYEDQQNGMIRGSDFVGPACIASQ